jgi:hypothetical protein
MLDFMIAITHYQEGISTENCDASIPEKTFMSGNIACRNQSIALFVKGARHMIRFRIGDTVAFRRDVAEKCASEEIRKFRARVEAIAGGWLFLREDTGREKVMRVETLSRVAHNGVILEIV